jgi:hypothetical protein
MHKPSMSRRRALQWAGAAMLSGAAGQLLLANRARAALDDAPPGLAAFRAVSTTLTGKASPDPTLALALYQAFQRTTPGFDKALVTLHAAPDDAQMAGPGLGQAILQAWYLGTVGKGRQAVCVTYLDALANRAVSAELTPPSYSYGPCGSWQARP